MPPDIAVAIPRLPWLRSLRARFALAMGAGGLALAVALTGYLEYRLEHGQFEAADRELQLVTQRIADRLANDLTARAREIQLTASVLGAARLTDRAVIATLLDQLQQQQPNYAWIGLTDRQGKVLVASQRLLENEDVSARPWFQGGLQGLYYGDPHDARLLGKKLDPGHRFEPLRFVDVAMPLRDAGGGATGVLAAHLYWNWVQGVVGSTLRQTGSPPWLQVVIADRSGALLLKPDGETALRLADLPAADRDGNRYLVGRAARGNDALSAGLGWTVLAREDMGHVLAPIRAERDLMLLVSVACGMVFVLLSWYLAGRVTRPLSSLAADAHGYRPASGAPFRSAVSQRADEVGTLARVLEELVHKLLVHAGREQLFIEHAPAPLAILDTELRYVAVSRRWLLDYGLEGRGLVGRRHQEVFPDLPERWHAIHQRALAGEVLRSEGERFSRADGSELWLRWEVRPWHTPDGAIGGIAIFSEDISLRRNAEHELRTIAQRLQLAAEAAKVGIFEWDIRSGAVTWSAELERIFGIEPAPAPRTYAHHDWQRFLHPEDRAMAVARAQSALGSGLPVEQEWRIIRADGQVRWVAARFQAFMDAEGRPAKMAGVNIDITRQKAMEAELRESARRLGEFNTELARQVETRTAEMRLARDEAEQANQAKSSFLATMSHEIRTPMNAIIGAAQVLERAELPADARRMVDAIRHAGRALLAIIDDVLDIAKIESGRFELDPGPFLLSGVMQSLVDLFSGAARNKGIALRLLPLPAAAELLVGDSHRLGQVLQNLVANAIRFTTAGEVTLSVTVVGRRDDRLRLRFAVTDTGIGIAADRLPHLFQAFVQADSSTSRHFGGSGLGLAICQRLVQLMGGEIGVTSMPGQGSEFWFLLPLGIAAAVPVAAPLAHPRRADGEGRMAGLRLLAVDDSTINLELLGRMLALEGARCDCLTDGEAALERLRSAGDAYDAVLMDVQMPGMDGLAAIRAIRGELRRDDLPVIALTAGALPMQREQALAAGMNDFLAKPFELEDLVATVLRQVAACQAARTRALPQPQVDAPTADTHGFPAVAGIDLVQVARRLLGDGELFLRSLRRLRSEFGDVAAALRQDLAGGDRLVAARRMHKLRGAAATLAAQRLAAAAAALEQQLQAPEGLPLDAGMAELAAALDEVLSGLPALLDANARPSSAVLPAAGA